MGHEVVLHPEICIPKRWRLYEARGRRIATHVVLSCSINSMFWELLWQAPVLGAFYYLPLPVFVVQLNYSGPKWLKQSSLPSSVPRPEQGLVGGLISCVTGQCGVRYSLSIGLFQISVHCYL